MHVAHVMLNFDVVWAPVIIGRHTVSDIAASIKEFPSRHFPSMFVGGVANHISNNFFVKGTCPDCFNLDFGL